MNKNTQPRTDPHYQTAVFASGCFWGTQYMFQKLNGVVKTTVGYTGGTTQKPNYQQICQGNTGHVEAVEVKFDPAMISYEQLVQYFYETHDPTQVNGQGPDLGYQYRSVIFYANEEQRSAAEKVTETLRAKGYKIATAIEPASEFWLAEEYHQDYYEKKNSTPYCHFYTKRF